MIAKEKKSKGEQWKNTANQGKRAAAENLYEENISENNLKWNLF